MLMVIFIYIRQKKEKMLSEEDKDAIRELVLVALQKSDEKEKQK